jgi:hypothetical protein
MSIYTEIPSYLTAIKSTEDGLHNISMFVSGGLTEFAAKAMGVEPGQQLTEDQNKILQNMGYGMTRAAQNVDIDYIPEMFSKDLIKTPKKRDWSKFKTIKNGTVCGFLTTSPTILSVTASPNDPNKTIVSEFCVGIYKSNDWLYVHTMGYYNGSTSQEDRIVLLTLQINCVTDAVPLIISPKIVAAENTWMTDLIYNYLVGMMDGKYNRTPLVAGVPYLFNDGSVSEGYMSHMHINIMRGKNSTIYPIPGTLTFD